MLAWSQSGRERLLWVEEQTVTFLGDKSSQSKSAGRFVYTVPSEAPGQLRG